MTNFYEFDETIVLYLDFKNKLKSSINAGKLTRILLIIVGKLVGNYSSSISAN